MLNSIRKNSTFWSTTGLFPQEIVISFKSMMEIDALQIVCYNGTCSQIQYILRIILKRIITSLYLSFSLLKYSFSFTSSAQTHRGAQHADASERLRTGGVAGASGTIRGRAAARGVPLRRRPAIRRTAPAHCDSCRLRSLRGHLSRAVPGQSNYCCVRRRAESTANTRRPSRLRLT